ncbi:MAG TPA: hypothetical protein PK095_04355 [Myxococcota bacterium]|nr:hypothetical protein [Myxococcota bacterium]
MTRRRKTTDKPAEASTLREPSRAYNAMAAAMPLVDIDDRELERRLVQSLARPVGRFAAAFGMPMANVLDLVQAAMLQVLRERGLTLAEVGRRLDVSERHAKRLLKQLRESFLDTERGYDLPVRIELLLWAQPMTRTRLKQVLRNEPDEPSAIDEVIDGLVASGRLVVDDARTPRLRPSATVQRLVRDTWMMRIGALNSLLSNVGDAVYGRFLDKSDRAFARTLSFLVRPEDESELARFFEEQLVPFMTRLDARANAERMGDGRDGAEGEDGPPGEAYRLSICWAPFDQMTRSVEQREREAGAAETEGQHEADGESAEDGTEGEAGEDEA